jgi:hypothetical protein
MGIGGFMRVFIYRNLRTGGYSIKDPKSGLVIGHKDKVCLTDVEFKVGKAGNARAKREKQRNVHAYVIGIMAKCFPKRKVKRVSYNPFKNVNFVLSGTDIAVYNAKKCILNSEGCYAVL